MYPNAFNQAMKDEMKELNAFIKESEVQIKKNRPQSLPKFNNVVKVYRNRIKKYKGDVMNLEKDTAFKAAVKRRKKTMGALKEKVKAMRRSYKFNPANLSPNKRKNDRIFKILGLKVD